MDIVDFIWILNTPTYVFTKIVISIWDTPQNLRVLLGFSKQNPRNQAVGMPWPMHSTGTTEGADFGSLLER